MTALLEPGRNRDAEAAARPARLGAAGPRVAVLIPCLNEEASVPRVIAAFRASLPDAAIYVYDNNSRDRTAEVARAAGARVRVERLQGKGHVLRRMFADVEADVVRAGGRRRHLRARKPIPLFARCATSRKG